MLLKPLIGSNSINDRKKDGDDDRLCEGLSPAVAIEGLCSGTISFIAISLRNGGRCDLALAKRYHDERNRARAQILALEEDLTDSRAQALNPEEDLTHSKAEIKDLKDRVKLDPMRE